MNTPDDALTPGERLHADNELKKLKLELEHRAQFFEGNAQASPEFVSDWLDHIARYEAQHQTAHRVTVYVYVGEPAYRPEADLADAEIGPELERLLAVMEENGVALAVLAPNDYDERTMYRFVTEVLFFEETDDLRMPGGFKQFTYEDFRPNHPHDVVNRIAEFIQLLAKGDFRELGWGMDDSFYDRTTLASGFKARPDVREKLDELVASWQPLVILDGFAANVTVADDAQTATATLVLHLGAEDQPPVRILEGPVQLRQDDNWWMLARVQLGGWVLA